MNRETIYELLLDSIREVMPGLEQHHFSPNDRLQDLGASSVDRAEIVTIALEAMSLRTPRVDLFGPRNIGELADLLYAKRQHA